MSRTLQIGGVSAVKVEVGVEVVGHLQPGFLQAGKRAAVGQQLGFERTSARFRLGVVGGRIWPGVAVLGTGCFDALATRQTSVLAAAVRVDDEARRGLT